MRERVPEAERRGQVVRYLKREHGFVDAGNVYGKGDSDRYSTPPAVAYASPWSAADNAVAVHGGVSSRHHPLV